MKRFLMLVLVCVFFGMANTALAGAAGKILTETVEIAAKRSGRALSPTAKAVARRTLADCVRHYGDDALKIASRGGLEAIDCMAKYGDDFIRLTGHSPDAARILALHADELMPLAQRIGPEFMKLETKVPGLGARAVQTFGDDAVPRLAKMSADDAAKVIALGCRADSPQTAKMLLAAAEKTGGKVLQHLDAKRILAYGLSAAMITGAYKVSGGVAEAVKTSPGTVTVGIWGVVSLVAGILILLYWSPVLIRKGWTALRRKPHAGA